MLSYVFVLFLIFQLARRAAAGVIIERQSITALTLAQIEAFQPYTLYAAAAYCPPSQTLSWTCGADCSGNPTFEPFASGGDGSDTQFWYVGWDPTLSSVVVAHQGTDPTSFLAILTDVDFILDGLDPTLFPGVPSSVQVHQGFALEQAKTAPEILAAVQTLLEQHSSSSVVLIGHSLGAALALLDTVYLPLHLPSGTRVRTIGYGMPRVGNQAFANYVDAMDSDGLTHINNREDPVPVIPPQFVGFVHPSGEVHIQDSGEWLACPGQDNPSPLCIVGDPNVLQDNILSDIIDHLGPYDDGIIMGCDASA